MSPETLVLVLAAALGGGTIAAVVNSISQRRKVGADATSVVTAAARELVDPLRRELNAERAEHSREVEMERQKVSEVRVELAAAIKEAQHLRGELAMARVEADELRRERELYREKDRQQAARILELERQSGR